MSEHQTIEWKELWQDEYLKWICGYANAYGDILYIGKKDESRTVVGIIVDKYPSMISFCGKYYSEIEV